MPKKISKAKSPGYSSRPLMLTAVVRSTIRRTRPVLFTCDRILAERDASIVVVMAQPP
nr:hypothetical protein OG461_06550 [Streptomyces sp. NBC_00995]